ncbi:MAG TPA: DegT/DnrJ/EryC1/StrS family aminotransferase [Solirubrobacteraceae bacterium]|jgi:dTDP-4-amino-4,6-dideoxygalactose transaminase|nr:DegT/DnrJ/EryC1/StrS family aminotransferase [Solirubrobacteraceae bacterium]
MSAVAAPPAAAIAHPRRWPVYEPAALERASALLAGGRAFDYDHGQELASFERAFADRHRRRHALALTSGTAGLLAAYFALGIEPGDEVVVSDFTFFSTATPLFLLGAVPVLCDAGCANGTVTAREVEACVGPRTAAIAVTHLWGHPCDMDPIRALAARRGLAVIEDCSHAHGSLYRGRPAGSLGDVAVFSVGGLKLISGGMGGVLLTDDDDLYARACLLANFRHRTDLTIPPGAYDDFLATGLGGNFRMTPVAAVLAQSHLDALDDLVARRAANVGALVDGLTALPGIGAVGVDDGCSMGAWYDGVVEVDESCRWTRDELAELLQRAGTKLRAPSTEPLHRYPIFRGAAPEWSGLAARAVRAAARANCGRAFPRADRLSDRWLRLPVNYLWDAEGSIVEPYVSAAAELL